MRSILVLNPKGGCGKSTIAMNIAACLADKDRRVALVDCDPQASCTDWLAVRPESAPPIIAGEVKNGKLHIPHRAETVVIDTPASVHGQRLANFIRLAQTLVIPVLPSPVDMRACGHFIDELYSLRKLINRKIKVVTLANRVREDTLAAAKLDYFLDHMKLPDGRHMPFITVLRNSQNYVQAAERGLGIFEFAPSRTLYDREQWEPLIRWLNSAHSIPS